jgi:hypothetical protein
MGVAQVGAAAGEGACGCSLSASGLLGYGALLARHVLILEKARVKAALRGEP